MKKESGINIERAASGRSFQGPRRSRLTRLDRAYSQRCYDRSMESSASEIPLKRSSACSPFSKHIHPLLSGKKITRILIVIWIILLPGLGKAAMTFPWEKKGEALYEKEKYAEALKSFLDEQVRNPKDQGLQYNIGSAQYRLQQYEEAAKAFSEAASSADSDLAEKALYNLGNTSYQQGKLEEAVAAYEKALQINPQDEDAKYNLEFVREEMKRRINDSLEREKNQQENPQKPDDKKDQKQDQGGEKKDQQQSQEQQKQPDQSPGRNQEQQKQNESASQDTQEEGAMSKKEAEALLQNIGEDRKNLQKENAKRLQGRSAMPDKDW